MTTRAWAAFWLYFATLAAMFAYMLVPAGNLALARMVYGSAIGFATVAVWLAWDATDRFDRRAFLVMVAALAVMFLGYAAAPGPPIPWRLSAQAGHVLLLVMLALWWCSGWRDGAFWRVCGLFVLAQLYGTVEFALCNFVAHDPLAGMWSEWGVETVKSVCGRVIGVPTLLTLGVIGVAIFTVVEERRRDDG